MSKVVLRESPLVTEMSVIPVAGHDSMLLNLSGAHGPFFTRNIVILKDNAGNTGVGEVPGGARIRQTLEDARPNESACVIYCAIALSSATLMIQETPKRSVTTPKQDAQKVLSSSI